MSVLRRVDPYARAIVGGASHVVLYMFDVAKNSWQRSDVEGAVFVVRRQPPRNSDTQYRLIIMNRLSDDNFVLDIGPTFRFDAKDPYLMFSSQPTAGASAGIIHGVWFHSAKDRGVVVDALSIAVASHTTSCGIADEETQTRRGQGASGARSVGVKYTSPPPDSSSTKAERPLLALDREELKAVLLSLIANDRFIDIIHTEYVSRQNQQ